jgi:iron uptake system EfeUOB component EfeO/EfeM
MDTTATLRCEIVQEQLHKLQHLEEELVAKLKMNEDQARALGDWYGQESYQPYIAVLQAQRQALDLQLRELNESACQSRR